MRMCGRVYADMRVCVRAFLGVFLCGTDQLPVCALPWVRMRACACMAMRGVWVSVRACVGPLRLLFPKLWGSGFAADHQ
jgi:hypothetical protein